MKASKPSEPSSHSFQFGAETITYLLSFTTNKRLSITVHPDRSVVVKAPKGRSLEDVEARLRKKASWIIRQLRRFEQFHPMLPPQQYVSGETHYYLGRQYRLKVHCSPEKCVKMIGGYIHVFTPEKENREAVKEIVEKWYREHAAVLLLKHAETCIAATRDLNIPRPEIQFRKMRRRWGSCGKSGKILLNADLIKAPISCIDYVITHELCHLKISSHSKEFYRLLSRYMPDWEARRRNLARIVP